MKPNINYNKLFSALFLIFVLGFASTSCRKECRNIEVPDIRCDNHYDDAEAQILYKPWGSVFLDSGSSKNIFIADSATYDSVFFNRRPFGDINFNDQFIIGIFRLTNEGFEVHVKAKLCIHTKENKLKLKVKYSVYDQCAGSNISKKPVSVWVILPIKYVDYDIIYDIEDINPWPH